MANVKISALPAATVVNDVDTFVIVQAGTTKKVTAKLAFQLVTSAASTILGISGAVSGAEVEWDVTNTSNTAGSVAGFVATVGGASAGDPYFIWSTGVTNIVAGLDNSDSDRWKLSNAYPMGGATNDIIAANPSTGRISMIRGKFFFATDALAEQSACGMFATTGA